LLCIQVANLDPIPARSTFEDLAVKSVIEPVVKVACEDDEEKETRGTKM